MINRTIKTIHKLRVFFLVFFVAAFYYNLAVNPINIFSYMGAGNSSAVGMQMSVEENPVNKLALQLKEREESLDQREEELDEKEAVLQGAASSANQKLMIVMLAGIIMLFLLITLNFILDFRRRRRGNVSILAK